MMGIIPSHDEAASSASCRDSSQLMEFIIHVSRKWRKNPNNPIPQRKKQLVSPTRMWTIAMKNHQKCSTYLSTQQIIPKAKYSTYLTISNQHI